MEERKSGQLDKSGLAQTVEKIDEHAGNVDREEKQQIHDREEQKRAESGRQCDPVEAV